MTPPNDISRTLLDELTSIVSRAAEAVLAARAGALATRVKADQSPVTAADHASEAVILEGLGKLLPGIPAVSEEACGDHPPTALPEMFFLVDPVDGTRELVAGRDEFCINLALIKDGRPIVGIIGSPATAVTWRGAEQCGAERMRLLPGAPASAAQAMTSIQPRPAPAAGLVIAASRSHFDPATQAFVARLPHGQLLKSGSAVKFCLVAEGTADIYPRLGPTMEWDVAAGHAVLMAAGGIVTSPDGSALRYGQIANQFRLQGFVAWGDKTAAQGLSLS